MSLFWSQLILLTLLSSILIFKLLRRERARKQACGAKSSWTGAAIDASSLRTRIQHLRENHVAAIRSHSTSSSHREQLVASIRNTIRRLACFQPHCIHPSATDPHETSGSRT